MFEASFSPRSNKLTRMRRFAQPVQILLLCAMLSIVIFQGRRVAAGIEVPVGQDAFRDAAQAQTIADGGWQSDQFFLGERLWYNPLTPALVAAMHKVSGAPIL